MRSLKLCNLLLQPNQFILCANGKIGIVQAGFSDLAAVRLDRVSKSVCECTVSLQANAQAAFDMERTRETERLRRERAALEKQSRAIAKAPPRKERAEIEALEAVVEQARKDAKSKDARHKLTVERLRRQIVTLQVRSLERQSQ